MSEFLKNEKTLNYFSIIFCVIYFLFAIAFIFCDYLTIKSKELEFKNLLAYVSSVNEKIGNNKFFEDQNNDNNVSAKPLFKDGKTAIISGYNDLINSSSFYLEVDGTISTVVTGINVINQLDYTVVKFSNEKIYENKLNYLIDTNAPSALLSSVKAMCNNSASFLKVNDNISYKETNKLIENGSNFSPDFSSSQSMQDNTIPLISENLFIINEETINKITYFKIKYKKDIPEFYYIQAELNLDNALIKYSKAMEKSSNSLKPLEYSKFIVTMCLNNKGVPVGLTTTEECKMLRDTPIGVQECPCKFSLNYTISYLNENINYEIKEF